MHAFGRGNGFAQSTASRAIATPPAAMIAYRRNVSGPFNGTSVESNVWLAQNLKPVP
jgi:hypothetical protein